MKKICLLILLAYLSSYCVVAQECSKEISLVNSLFEKLNVEQALNDPAAISTEFENLKNSLGNLSLMSLKKDTPKLLFLNGKDKKGQAKAGKKKIYVTSLIQKDALTLHLSNLNLKAEGLVIVCSHAKNGSVENLEHVSMATNDPTETLDFNIQKQRGKILSITVKNTGSTEKLEFKLRGSY